MRNKMMFMAIVLSCFQAFVVCVIAVAIEFVTKITIDSLIVVILAYITIFSGKLKVLLPDKIFETSNYEHEKNFHLKMYQSYFWKRFFLLVLIIITIPLCLQYFVSNIEGVSRFVEKSF